MIESVAANDAPALKTEEKPARGWQRTVYVRDNSRMTSANQEVGTPADRFFMPWQDNGDQRLFVKNGKLQRAYGMVVFKFQQLVLHPYLPYDEAVYTEVVRSDFDPTDCVGIEIFNPEQFADALNIAYMKGEKLPESIQAISDANAPLVAPPVITHTPEQKDGAESVERVEKQSTASAASAEAPADDGIVA